MIDFFGGTMNKNLLPGENLIGNAFFYSLRKELFEKLPMFRKAFDILYNPEK